MGVPIKYWITPKQFSKFLKEKREMNTSIIDFLTLTEEQIREIKILYMYAKTDIDGYNEIGQIAGYARKTLLEELFGEEFFEKGE